MDLPDAPLGHRNARVKLASALVLVLFFATCAIVQQIAPEALADIRLKSASAARPWLLLLIVSATFGILLPALTGIPCKWRIRKKNG
jgi:hypothetical protein